MSGEMSEVAPAAGGGPYMMSVAEAGGVLKRNGLHSLGRRPPPPPPTVANTVVSPCLGRQLSVTAAAAQPARAATGPSFCPVLPALPAAYAPPTGWRRVGHHHQPAPASRGKMERLPNVNNNQEDGGEDEGDYEDR